MAYKKHFFRIEKSKTPRNKYENNSTFKILLTLFGILILSLAGFVVYNSFRNKNEKVAQTQPSANNDGANQNENQNNQEHIDILNNADIQPQVSSKIRDYFLNFKNQTKALHKELCTQDNINSTNLINSVIIKYLSELDPDLSLFSNYYVNLYLIIDRMGSSPFGDQTKLLTITFVLILKDMVSIAFQLSDISHFSTLANLTLVKESHHAVVYFIYQHTFIRRILDVFIKYIEKFENEIIECYSKKSNTTKFEIVKTLFVMVEAVFPYILRKGEIEAPISKDEIFRPFNLLKSFEHAKEFLFVNFLFILLQIFEANESHELIKVKDENRSDIEHFINRNKKLGGEYIEIDNWEKGILEVCKDVFVNLINVDIERVKQGLKLYESTHMPCFLKLAVYTKVD